MKYLFYSFMLFVSIAHGQNITSKSFAAKGISTLHINGNAVFKIHVETQPIDVIEIYSRVEGENNEQMVLLTRLEESILFVSTKYQPLFQDANDKLSAHKVISVELTIFIPENMHMELYSDIANVIVKGRYENVSMDLMYGNCFFQAFHGNAKIQTREGNIVLNTNAANISAISKNGSILKEKTDSGVNNIIVKTINGNITITKSQ